MKLTSIITLAAVGLAVAAGPTGLLDEFKLPNSNAESPTGGIWAPDNDVPSGGNSQVLIASTAGNFPAGTALDIASCPTGDSQTTGTSDCYWGWNTGDAYATEGLTSLLEVTTLINPTGWGWASAGWYYIFSYDANAAGEGAFDKSTPVTYATTDKLVLSFKYPSGSVLTLALYEKLEQSVVDNSLFARPKLKITGSGAMQEMVIPFTDFAVPAWATAGNAVDVALGNLTAISFLREEAASTQGETPSTIGGANELVIGKLCINDCGAGTSAILGSEQVQKMSFGLKNGSLQFSNVKGNVDVQVFNTMGQRIVSKVVNANSRSVALNNLNKGVYLVRTLDQDGLQMTRKIAF